jgi:predicted nucleic acid-binding protein
MGLADAIIAATALVHELPLATRNEDDFKHVTGLRVINPFAS